ncbi:MAG: pitrilysin family protein, partial [Candidatus Cloacimonetes bacterium]|nr:pitrilysin family protein [Candidatus Cloacimonadota bacterium]
NSISRFASGLGGMLNAYTDYDCTCYYLLLPRENLESGLYILSQLAYQSTFSFEDVVMEKDIIIEEIKQYENDPEPDFIEYIQKTYFKKSPLSLPVLGNVRSIRYASYEDLAAFYKNKYAPNNSFLVVCGDFEPDTLSDRVSTYFGSWAAKKIRATYPKNLEPELNPFRLQFRKRLRGEEFLAFVMPELCEKHPYSNALLIAMRYLAIGKASRLYKRLVEEDKLYSSVKVSSFCGVLSGASVIVTCPLNRKSIPKIMDVFKQEFYALTQHGIPADELYLIKQDIIHSWLYSFDGMENLANLVAAEEFIGNLDLLHTYGNQIATVSMEDVFLAMDKYWHPEFFSIYHEGSKEVEAFSQFNMQEAESNRSSDKQLTYPIFESLARVANTNPTSTVTQIDDFHYQIRLSNGMQVLFKQLKQKSVTGFSLSTHISQLCEASEKRGVNLFTSAALLYGSELHTHEQLMRYSRQHGFNIRVIHHLDSTSYRGKCQNTTLSKALSTLSEIISLPRFDNVHLQMLLSSALDGIRRDKGNPVAYAYQKWFKLLVGDKSNLNHSSGNSADIRSLRLKDIKSWYADWCIPRDFSLAIVGSHQLSEIVNLCEDLFGSFKHTETNCFISKPVYQSSDIMNKKQYRDSDQAIIHLGGFATPAHLYLDNAAFHVLAQILGGDISSIFFEILREKYGFAYQTGFDFSSVKELGFWNAYAFCDKKDYRKCLMVMQEILADIMEKGINEAQLQTAKQYLIGMNRFDYESVSYTASSISNLASLGYEPQFYINREDRLRAIDSEIINKIAKQWLIESNQYLHILL